MPILGSFKPDYTDWIGGAGMAIVEALANSKIKRLTSRFDNGTLANAGVLLANGFGQRLPLGMDKYARGASSYAAGSLANRYLVGRITGAVQAITTTPVNQPVAQTQLPAPTGVAASGGSAVYDQTVAGY